MKRIIGEYAFSMVSDSRLFHVLLSMYKCGKYRIREKKAASRSIMGL